MTGVLKVENLTKKIGRRTLVDNISFEISQGEIFGLLGPNGAGKTTTIRMLVGLARPTNGKISICGHDIQREHRTALGKVGTIVENPELYPYLSGIENLRQFARLSGGVDDEKIREIVHLVGLEERIGEKVRRYSLGMRQRLGLGQALLHNPPLLILDEPTNGLDPSGMREFRSLLKTLADKGTSILISSHLLSEIEQICDTVGVIQQGKWITTSRVSELKGETNKGLVLHVDSAEHAKKTLMDISDITTVSILSDTSISVEYQGESLNPILLPLLSAGIQIKRIEERNSSLEEAFLELTGGLMHA